MIGIAEEKIEAGECKVALSGGPGLWEVRPGEDGGEIVYLEDERSIAYDAFCVVEFSDCFSFFEVEWSHLGTPSIIERTGREDWAFIPEDGSITWTAEDASKGVTISTSSTRAYALAMSETGTHPSMILEVMLAKARLDDISGNDPLMQTALTLLDLILADPTA